MIICGTIGKLGLCFYLVPVFGIVGLAYAAA